MFESTLPGEAADLMGVSAFRRYLASSLATRTPHTAGTGTGTGTATRLTSLNPSLMQDLQRFERNDGGGTSLQALEVFAAALRHGRWLRIHVRHESRVLPLTVFPAENQVHSPLPMAQLLVSRWLDMQVLHVEPAQLVPLGDRDEARSGEPHLYSPLGPLLWELALRGTREDLLPEIAGVAAYRIAPAADLSALHLSGSLAAAVARLQRETTNLANIASWPGFDHSRATRMLNGLYLQAALMISRSHPAATHGDWRSPPTPSGTSAADAAAPPPTDDAGPKR